MTRQSAIYTRTASLTDGWFPVRLWVVAEYVARWRRNGLSVDDTARQALLLLDREAIGMSGGFIE